MVLDLSSSLSRRKVLQGLGAASLVAASSASQAVSSPASPAFVSLQRQPDAAWVVTGDAEDAAPRAMGRNGERWSAAGVELRCVVLAEGLDLTLAAPKASVRRVHLRWAGKTAETTRVLGDAWERSYGDLAWMAMQPERVLPWYCVLETGVGPGASTHGFGVKTGAGAFCFWQVDGEGISLWLDVRNGGNGVVLGERELTLARVIERQGHAGETAFAAARALCGLMAPEGSLREERGGLPVATIFGSNDWYYAYGKNTPAGILRDAELMGRWHRRAGRGRLR